MRRLAILASALAIVVLLKGVVAARPHKARKARASNKTAVASVKGPAASCTARDPHVAVPGSPHGMYVWNPYKVQGGKYEKQLESTVIGKDPTLCGVSLVVSWSSAEPSKGSLDWSSIQTQAAPYLRAHLRYNLLFADASEVGTSDSATPAWVFNQDHVARVQCPKQVPYPNFLDSKFENDWASFIAAAVKKFGSDSSVGYMRFGIGAGVEAYPGHMESKPPRPCYNAWVKTAQWTYAKWVKHSLNVVGMLARQQSNKQLMVAMNYIEDSPTVYAYANSVSAAAAPRGIAFGTENLGIGHVAAPGAKPGPCNPQAKKVNLYWCQAFKRHAGKVPFEFQPIAATTPGSTQGYQLDISKLLQYAIANKAQILELYPQEWLARDAEHKSALRAAAQVLGVAH
ncbi:MAG TPA: hypothetical protein VFW34_09325 [Candidatus Rubrimentiphilum sp.]|nr:hypothetical protein [Candidatus Rubrimentiphilum sp.]